MRRSWHQLARPHPASRGPSAPARPGHRSPAGPRLVILADPALAAGRAGQPASQISIGDRNYYGHDFKSRPGKQRSIPAPSGHRRGYPGPQRGRMVRSGEVPADILRQAGTRGAGTAWLQALAARPVTAGQDRRCLSGACHTDRALRRAGTGTGRAAHTASARSPAREGRRPGGGDPASGAGSRPHRRQGHHRHRDGRAVLRGARSGNSAGADGRSSGSREGPGSHRRAGPGDPGCQEHPVRSPSA